MKTYSVRPSWRNRGILVKSDSAFFALHRAAERDYKLTPYCFGTDMGQSLFDWGTRFQRGRTFVDVVRMH